jgi:hypothetical protein
LEKKSENKEQLTEITGKFQKVLIVWAKNYVKGISQTTKNIFCRKNINILVWLSIREILFAYGAIV